MVDELGMPYALRPSSRNGFRRYFLNVIPALPPPRRGKWELKYQNGIRSKTSKKSKKITYKSDSRITSKS